MQPSLPLANISQSSKSAFMDHEYCSGGKAFKELPFPAGSSASIRAACMEVCCEETHRLYALRPQ